MAVREVGTLRTRLSFEDEGAVRSLKGFRDDLRGLSAEMNVARSRGREYTQSLKGLREQADILTRRLEVQRRQVEELRRRYEESKRAKGETAQQTRNLANQYNNALAAMNRTEQQLKQVTAEIERQTNTWHKLSESAEQHGKRLQSLGQGLTDFGRKYTMRVTTPILGAAGAALKVGMDFEEAMSKVQAISGATGKELEQMSALARELGATTRFSATEAASGMEFLAMAGFNTSQILASMPGLLDLAAASGMDLGRAADITTNIMSGFNLEASEAGRVADVLAKGASTANTTVQQLGDAMKYAAPIAATLGLEIEGLTAAVGFMSDAGIQGEQAGRQLRQGLLRLANPTGEAAKLMDRLGINVFDAQGNMKSMHEIVAELERGLGNMTPKARASALAILFGAESTAGWATLLDRGSKALAEYTEALENSQGAAAEMARIMESNAKGAMREFRSAVEEIGIAFSEHMIPVITDFLRRGTELVRKFGELDAEQQKQIIKWGLMAAAIGPASIAMGQLVTSIGGLLRLASSLFNLLGAAGGTGLLGRIGMLGMSGPVGLAVAGVGALGAGIYALVRHSREAKQITTETADALWEQADALEPNIERFEELQRRSKLTTDEFGRLLDIQKELSDEIRPEMIEALQKEYEQLAEKSGLSNDELDEMIRLNNDIIEQAPVIEKTFTDKGNAIIESTDALKEYVQSLRTMAMEELQIERIKALEREAELREENRKLNEEIAAIEEQINTLIQYHGVSLSEVETRLVEIDQLIKQGVQSEEELQALMNERGVLLAIQNGNLLEALETLQKQREELIKKRDLNEEELAKLDAIHERMADLLLAEVDLNYEKGEGLKRLDEKIRKLKDQKAELEELVKQEGAQTDQLWEQIGYLDMQIRQHEGIRGQLIDILGLEERQNEQLTAQYGTGSMLLDLLLFQKEHMSDITSQQEQTNRRIDDGVSKAREMNKELSKDIDKRVDVDDRGTAARVHREAEKPATKQVTLRAVWTNVVTGLTAALANFRFPGFAKGTNFAPGGPALVGEEGFELARYKDKWALLDFGIVNLPRGTQVFTHEESKKILRALQNIPAFATGASSPGDADRIVQQLNSFEDSSGTVSINMYGPVYMRSDEDIRLLARELNRQQKSKFRGAGIK